MSSAFCCEVCDRPDPTWRIDRRGDAVVSWACDEHLPVVCRRLQRYFEVTELVVRDRGRLCQWVAAHSASDGDGA